MSSVTQQPQLKVVKLSLSRITMPVKPSRSFGCLMRQVLGQRNGVEVIGVGRGEEDTVNPATGVLSGPLLLVGRVVVEV